MIDIKSDGHVGAIAAVPRETIDKLRKFEEMVAHAQRSQNLVSTASLEGFWERHVLDSAQLINFARPGDWIDIGSGAGIPGIIVGLLTRARTSLIEPRRLRAEFLRSVIEDLALENVEVVQSTVQAVRTAKVANITARAVAPLSTLIRIASHLADSETIWILPKGKTAQSELDTLPRSWQGQWTVEDSVTDPFGKILVGRNVKVIERR